MKSKFFGVIEGFYRRPYSFSQRCDLVQFLNRIGLNTYVYGPKSDPYHRKEYHKPYPKEKLKEFEFLKNLAIKNKIIFNYALSPGSKPDLNLIIKKLSQFIDIGISNFSLFFDDIKILMNSQTAQMQAEIGNSVLQFLHKKVANPTLFFCPTQYRGFDRTEYLLKIAEKLNPDIFIFWTGKSVISKRITVKDVEKIKDILGRKMLIWDNIFANDYIPGVILRFPYHYREPGIIEKVSGILLNPMNQYEKSKPLISTAAKFFKDPYNYVPRKAWQEVSKRFS